MRKNPIFLLGNHKSGTSLLRSLFDGVEGYAVLPIETHPFQILEYGIRYPYRKQNPKPLNFNEAVEKSVEWIRKSNTNNDKYSDGLTLNKFDEALFRDTIKADDYTNKKEFIENYFISVYNAYKVYDSIKSNERFVEKSVENVEFALDLKKIFPDSKFIHIIRNPYANLVSLRKYKTTNVYPRLDKPIKAISDSYYYLYRNERLIENYQVIQYEELINNPNLTIKTICKKLNLEFDAKMLTPTVDGGKNWQGNSTTNAKFSGISNKGLHQWENQIYPVEIGLVNKLFPHILKRFDYEKLKSGKVYQKSPEENLKIYIFNRFLLKFTNSLI